MNVIVIPDGAMIVIPLIEKNGHTYLSPSNFSKYDNMDICEGNLTFDNMITRYSSSEIPSGVKGRLFLLSNIINDVDAAIIIGKRPKMHEKIYDTLNDLILFGANSCNNAHSLSLKIVKDFNIPTLMVPYPKNREEIISLINRTNDFLKNLKDIDGNINECNLSTDLRIKKDKYPTDRFKDVLDNLI